MNRGVVDPQVQKAKDDASDALEEVKQKRRSGKQKVETALEELAESRETPGIVWHHVNANESTKVLFERLLKGTRDISNSTEAGVLNTTVQELKFALGMRNFFEVFHLQNWKYRCLHGIKLSSQIFDLQNQLISNTKLLLGIKLQMEAHLKTTKSLKVVYGTGEYNWGHEELLNAIVEVLPEKRKKKVAGEEDKKNVIKAWNTKNIHFEGVSLWCVEVKFAW